VIANQDLHANVTGVVIVLEEVLFVIVSQEPDVRVIQEVMTEDVLTEHQGVYVIMFVIAFQEHIAHVIAEKDIVNAKQDLVSVIRELFVTVMQEMVLVIVKVDPM